MTKKLDLTGIKRGFLTVTEEQGKKLLCLCDCGNIKTVYRGNFLAGYTQSCGCLQKSRTSKANTKHGERQNPIYCCWQAMKRRCYNPMHRAYPWYGGKGIKVCERWQTFKNFYIDMIDGYQIGLTLDRRDSSKDYSKENCTWATKKDNSRNLHGKALP